MIINNIITQNAVYGKLDNTDKVDRTHIWVSNGKVYRVWRNTHLISPLWVSYKSKIHL
jgi:hypothetical protein